MIEHFILKVLDSTQSNTCTHTHVHVCTQVREERKEKRWEKHINKLKSKSIYDIIFKNIFIKVLFLYGHFKLII